MRSRASTFNHPGSSNGTSPPSSFPGSPVPAQIPSTPSSPSLSTSSPNSSPNSKKLPKFLQSRSKGPKGKEIPVPINPSMKRRGSLQDNGFIVESPTNSTSSEDSSAAGSSSPRWSPKSRRTSPMPIPTQSHRPVSPSPLNDTSLPTRISSWISNSSTSALSLPSILTSHSSITKHLSLPSPGRRGRLSIGSGSSGKFQTPSSPVSDASNSNVKKNKSRQMLDKVVRYVMDTDADHDGCTDPIHLLGEVYVFPTSLGPPDGLPVTLQPHSAPLRTSSPSPSRSPIIAGSPPRQRAEGVLSTPPDHLRASTSGSSSSSNGTEYMSVPSSPASTASRASRFLHHPHRNQDPTTPKASEFPPIHDPPATAPAQLMYGYPCDFYEDFSSRIWLTYRGGWEVPLRADMHLGELPLPANLSSTTESSISVPLTVSSRASGSASGASSQFNSVADRGSKQKWGNNLLATFGIGSKEFTSDAGWGCMLRTGQCVLAEALVRVHLGRGFRRFNVTQEKRQAYSKLLTWFMDTPSPHAPFSVHRMALAGKGFGTEVGTWFGPSTAAGAIKSLVAAFPDCGLGVCAATDSMLFQTDVIKASRSLAYMESHHRNHSNGTTRSSRFKHKMVDSPPNPTNDPEWGDRPVLILCNIRLGLDGVNPIYYENIKKLYTFPQCTGIAGGRPSSSYWFIGVQGHSLIYLDPHHARQAISPRGPDGNLDYDDDELATFHYKKEWLDLRKRLSELPKGIGVYIQDEPPAWARDGVDLSEDDSLLESVSDSASNLSDDLDMPSTPAAVPARVIKDEDVESLETERDDDDEQGNEHERKQEKVDTDWDVVTPTPAETPKTAELFAFPRTESPLIGEER
ncbi:hypothetical protein DL96DRAFT_1713252 [Flagelloscypha sp. PMI_526]|nr:hypothetical protein DL96DRAFT_1713252 [Flagelloscypha sp. PMI_526]